MTSTSTFSLFLRLTVSLAVVLALMILASRLIRNRGGFVPTSSASRGAQVEVLARKPLSRTTSIAVVRAGGRDIVVGVTETTISVLAEADPEALQFDTTDPHGTLDPGGNDRPSPPWKTALDALREKSTRRV